MECYKCFCNQVFKLKSDWLKHVKSCFYVLHAAKFLDNLFDEKIELHVIDCQKKYSCLCENFSFTSQRDFRKHVKYCAIVVASADFFTYLFDIQKWINLPEESLFENICKCGRSVHEVEFCECGEYIIKCGCNRMHSSDNGYCACGHYFGSGNFYFFLFLFP